MSREPRPRTQTSTSATGRVAPPPCPVPRAVALSRTGRANALSRSARRNLRVVTAPAQWERGPGHRARRLPVHTTRFAHHRLDAFQVAKSALVAGDAIVRRLPRGYGPLADQL